MYDQFPHRLEILQKGKVVSVRKMRNSRDYENARDWHIRWMRKLGTTWRTKKGGK